MHIKRVTLTSKKNWWMVELDEEEENVKPSPHSFSSDDTVYDRSHYPSYADYTPVPPTPHTAYSHLPHQPSPPASPPVYNPPRHPTSIFSFPTPTTYSAPPNPTSYLAPFAVGSTSELYKCIVKKPDVVQLEINGEMQTNATDVTTQFLAELRVYTTVPRHPNLPTFLGCLDNVGMVLEFIEGRTLWDVLKENPDLPAVRKRDYHNQLLDGLVHIHATGLSHGDLSLLNVQVTNAGVVKILDFGRSVHADSIYESPDSEPVDPFAHMQRPPAHANAGSYGNAYRTPQLPPLVPSKRVEQIHPGTRPFCAPEILRGECQDARLADAYSFGMILVCLEKCTLVDVKPWDQRKDLLPKDFLDGCELFGDRIAQYLKKWSERRRLVREDMVEVDDERMSG
ncbi:kinase-like protein [Dentipellis sp. KUC8613]|nr:kinase-like protein [Dentipellis sp. KUC8613]